MSETTDEDVKRAGEMMARLMAREFRAAGRMLRDLGYEEEADAHDAEADRIERGDDD